MRARERLSRLLLRAAAALLPREHRYLVVSLEKGAGPAQERFFYQSKYVDFGIKPGEKVLDIGSGQHPFPLATHLADPFEAETTHRAEPLVKDQRPFQACRIERMPYADHEFDFVYCSHVLEHVEDPAKACREIMRVGRRGYIETPTRLSDVMLNFTRLKGHHRWHVTMAGDTLFFFEWADRDRRDTGCHDFYWMLQSIYKNAFQDLFYSHWDLFANMMLWRGSFSYCVVDKQGRIAVEGRSAGAG